MKECKRAGIEKESESKADQMVWPCGKNGLGPYGKKDVDGESKRRTGTR